MNPAKPTPAVFPATVSDLAIGEVGGLLSSETRLPQRLQNTKPGCNCVPQAEQYIGFYDLIGPIFSSNQFVTSSSISIWTGLPFHALIAQTIIMIVDAIPNRTLPKP